jgi:hypothetical protein
MLAKLHRAGKLIAIWIPDAAHEAMRDLVRAARATAGRVLSMTRQHLQGFLLRDDRSTTGLVAGRWPIRRWLSRVPLDHPRSRSRCKITSTLSRMRKPDAIG